MPNDTQQSNTGPDWIRAVMHDAPVRNGLILFGNVNDIFFDEQQHDYVSLPELLIRLLMRERDLGFTLASVWDQADGLRFPDAAGQRRFRELLGGRSAPAQSGGQAYDVGDTAPQAASIDRLYPEPANLFPAMGTVMATKTEKPLFILDWTHLLVGQPDHPSPEERQWMLQLGKLWQGDPVCRIDSDALRTNTGLIILIAANLGKIPPALYQHEPRVRLISVETPRPQQRKSFFIRHMDDLRCELPTGSDREAVADTLTDLTDQLQMTDLRQVLCLSFRTPSPLPPGRLLNLYRLGDQRSPWEELSETKLRQVDEVLRRRVVGQDEAIEHVATMAIRGFLGLAGLQHSSTRGKPKGILLFVGPTGVGKTELAKALAEFLFGDESACIRFDMSEYNQPHSDQRLVGAPPGYVGFEEGGQLTNAVRERPFSILLFDEIEKSHPKVMDKFLQILEDGRLTDGRGETAHFSETVIIFTSNIGAATMPDSDDPQVIHTHFEDAVKEHFEQKLGRPELLNRFGENIVVFRPILDNGFRRQILDRKLNPLESYLLERFGVRLRVADDLKENYVRRAKSRHGGRGLLNVLERDLLNPLSRFLFDHLHQLRSGRILDARLLDDQTRFELMEI